MRFFIFAILSAFLISPKFCFAETATPERSQKILDLQKRIQELEKKQSEYNEWYTNFYNLGKGRVNPFTGNRLALGGFFETGLTQIYGPNTEYQIAAQNHALGFNVSADYTDRMRFVAQTLTTVNIPLFNPNNNPNINPPQRKYTGLSGGTLVAQGYFEYRYSDRFNVQTGIGYMPFGIAYQQREPYLFHPRNGPQLINNDDGFNIAIVSALWLGVHLYGLLPWGEDNIGYNLYTMTPGSNVASFGGGGRLWWTPTEFLTTGISVQYGERRNGSYVARGIDFDLKYANLGFIGEYAINESTGDTPDSEFYYIEPYINFFEGEFIFYVSAEYLRAPNRIDVFTFVPDPFEQKYYGMGINWLPIPNAKLRLGFLHHDYVNEPDTITENRDYDAIDLSTAISF